MELSKEDKTDGKRTDGRKLLSKARIDVIKEDLNAIQQETTQKIDDNKNVYSKVRLTPKGILLTTSGDSTKKLFIMKGLSAKTHEYYYKVCRCDLKYSEQDKQFYLEFSDDIVFYDLEAMRTLQAGINNLLLS